MKLLATDERIPRPLRWLVIAGAAPIPGPIDEAILLLAALLLFLFYRPIIDDAWQRSRVTADVVAAVQVGGSSNARTGSAT